MKTDSWDVSDELIQAEKRRTVAEITSAITLSDALRKKISARLSELTGGDPDIRYKIDESMIGGITIRLDGKL